MNRQPLLPARTRMMVDRIVRVGERYLCQLYLGQAEEEKRQHADRKCLHVLEFVRGPAKSQSPRGSASRRRDVTLERFVATDAHVACPAGGCPSSRLARYTRGPIGAPEWDTPPATTSLEEDDGRDRIVVVDAHAVALSGRAETEATDRADAGRSNVPRHVPLGLREDEKDPQSGRWKLLRVAAGSHRVLSQMQMANVDNRRGGATWAGFRILELKLQFHIRRDSDGAHKRGLPRGGWNHGSTVDAVGERGEPGREEIGSGIGVSFLEETPCQIKSALGTGVAGG